MFSADLGVTPSASTLYAEDVFSTFLYTGTGSALTINNGIDLAGKGGMVWIKARDGGPTYNDHFLMDSTRGVDWELNSNTTDAHQSLLGAMSSFNSNGFTLNGGFRLDQTSIPYASWTFRKAPKFFDVVTYTGDGTDSKVLNHSLGMAPGLIIVKSTSTSGAAAAWLVWHRKNSYLNGTSASEVCILALNLTNIGNYNETTRFPSLPTDSSFLVGDSINTSGVNYVAYLFANDTTTSGVIRCDSFTTDASGNASVTSLGWEPQFLMVKASSTNGDWIMLDAMRGWNMTSADALLRANLSNAETASTEYGNPTATGFDFKGGAASATYVYMAIRRPNKPPTSGTDVLVPALNAANSVAGLSSVGAAKSPDMMIGKARGGSGTIFVDRLRALGVSTASTSSLQLDATGTAAETSGSNIRQYDWQGGNDNSLTTSPITWLFKRAPGFFDIVCYTGTGSARTVAHNLGAKPELLIIKRRDAVSNSGWTTTAFSLYGAVSGGWRYHWLNLSNNYGYADPVVFPDTEPTTSVFSLGSTADVNASGGTYVAYLFASLPGISKIGTYTGNGTTQTINCGFAAGARFVLIKRLDAAGDWYVWDTARGIVAAEDAHLSLNSTAAEVTTDDSVDPVSSGFAVNQLAATNINVSSATYLYFAVS